MENYEEIIQESMQTAERIRELQFSKHRRQDRILETIRKSDKARYLFPPYDQMAYEGKMRVDMLFYESFLRKLDSDIESKVEQKISDMYKTVRKIYEHVNIKPESILSIDVLSQSIDEIDNTVKNTVFEFIDNTYNRLNINQRMKYFDEHVEIAKKLITEGESSENASLFGIKVVLMEKFLKKLAFPLSVWSRVKYLSTDDEYGEVFEQDTLIDLMSEFETDLRKMSKVIAACI